MTPIIRQQVAVEQKLVKEHFECAAFTPQGLTWNDAEGVVWWGWTMAAACLEGS
jgi:hypothetical protein